jgi:hypothetical protein
MRIEEAYKYCKEDNDYVLLLKELLTDKKYQTQHCYKTVCNFYKYKIKFNSLNELIERIEKTKISSSGLDIQILRYGIEEGTKRYNEHIKINSEKNSGENNAMFGVDMITRLQNKHGEDWEKYYEKFKENSARPGVLNGSFGKTNQELCFNKWMKSGLTIEECKIKYHLNQNKNVASGERNGSFGKTPNHKCGAGWSGRYKNYYFRSLLELSYIIYLEENNINFKSAECIRIKYKDENNNIKTYAPDFLLIDENKIVELKPKNLQKMKINLLKFEAARIYSSQNNYEFIVMDFPLIKMDKITILVESNIIKFNAKPYQKYLDYLDKLNSNNIKVLSQQN